MSLCWNPHRQPGSTGQNCVSVWDGLQQRALTGCSAVLLLFQCLSSRSLVEKCSVLICKHGGKQRVSSNTNAGCHLQHHLPLSAAHLLPPSRSVSITRLQAGILRFDFLFFYDFHLNSKNCSKKYLFLSSPRLCHIIKMSRVAVVKDIRNN